MEAMVALRYGLEGLFGPIVRKADRASALVRLREPLALSQHYFRVRLDDHPIEARSEGRTRREDFASDGAAPGHVGLHPAAEEAKQAQEEQNRRDPDPDDDRVAGAPRNP